MATISISLRARTRGLWRIRLLSVLAELGAMRMVRALAHWAANGVHVDMKIGRGKWEDVGVRLVAHQDGTITRIDVA